jgi:hypothetical protein
MIRRSHTLLIGCTCLVATSLGAAPATQPVDLRRENVELKAKVTGLEAQARLLQSQVELFQSGKVHVPRTPETIPSARAYVTPKSDWKPKEFNGQTIYIIPCETAMSSTASVAVKVDVGTLVIPTKAASVAPAQPKR